MTYVDGETVRIGDTVHLGAGQSGVVVALIEEGRYADGYAEADWKHLGGGLVVSTEFGDLRLPEPDEDLRLVARLAPSRRFG